MRNLITCLSVCVFSSITSAMTPVVNEEYKLVASDGIEGDMFGTSVSMDGNLSIVGALDTLEGLPYGPGAAYIYRFNGSEWVEEIKLMSGVQNQDWFGAAVTIQGDIAVVTSVFNGANGDGYGCAYVYKINGGQWNLETVLGGDGGEYTLYGSSVSISEDTLVVGAPWESIGGNWGHQGATYVYRFTSDTWILEQKIYSNDPSLEENFGASVAIKDNLIIVGAKGDKMMAVEGKAYIFRRDGSSWNQEAVFSPTSIPSGNGACCVYNFYCSITDIDCCIELGGEWKNGATCEEMWCGEDVFANSVSISSDNALVSSSSQGCYLYRYSKGTWEQDAILVPSTCDLAGVKAVCIEGETILAGSHIYRFNGKMWEEQITLQGSDNPSSLGTSVAMSGNKAIVGASGFSDVDIGSAYIFDITEPVCSPDINGDGIVNVSDLLTIIDQWGLTDSPADVNDDGIVDVSDLLIVVGNWGECE
jgi:hypothetical protein